MSPPATWFAAKPRSIAVTTTSVPFRLALILFLMVGFAASAPAQIKAPDKKEDAKLREKEKAKAEKDARRYDKL
jgi:hypothetical protein